MPLVLALLWSATALADEPPPAPQPPSASPSGGALRPSTALPLKPPSGPVLSEIDQDALPPACRELGTLAESTSANRALSARIALANCLVDDKAKALVLCDCEQSVLEVNDILEPSLALLDEVVENGNPALQILARHAEGQLLASFSTRLLDAVPPPVNTTTDALALRETRLAMMKPLLEPWLRRSQAAFAAIDQIARAHPALDKNRAVAAAVRDSQARLAQVARR